jgi:hypothetical protein
MHLVVPENAGTCWVVKGATKAVDDGAAPNHAKRTTATENFILYTGLAKKPQRLDKLDRKRRCDGNKCVEGRVIRLPSVVATVDHK